MIQILQHLLLNPVEARSNSEAMLRARMKQTVLPETVILTTLCLIDMAWTIAAIQLGMARESNPIMAFLIGKSLFLFAFMKILSFLIPLTCLELLRAKIPQFVTMSIRIGLALYVGIYIVGSLHANGVF